MLTSIELEKAKTFWQWFAKNRFAFEFMPDIEPEQKNKLFNNCSLEMEKYCEGLSPVIGPEISEKGGLRFIVSAAGDTKYFQQAKDLAAQAPEFPNWNIIGLVPPVKKGVKLQFTFADIVLDPNQIGVALANVSTHPNHLAILVGLKEFDASQPELMVEVRDTVVQLMTNLCGEEIVGKQIQYMELRAFPDDPDAEGYHKMYRLPELIQQFREECPTPC